MGQRWLHAVFHHLGQRWRMILAMTAAMIVCSMLAWVKSESRGIDAVRRRAIRAKRKRGRRANIVDGNKRTSSGGASTSWRKWCGQRKREMVTLAMTMIVIALVHFADLPSLQLHLPVDIPLTSHGCRGWNRRTVDSAMDGPTKFRMCGTICRRSERPQDRAGECPTLQLYHHGDAPLTGRGCWRRKRGSVASPTPGPAALAMGGIGVTPSSWAASAAAAGKWPWRSPSRSVAGRASYREDTGRKHRWKRRGPISITDGGVNGRRGSWALQADGLPSLLMHRPLEMPLAGHGCRSRNRRTVEPAARVATKAETCSTTARRSVRLQSHDRCPALQMHHHCDAPLTGRSCGRRNRGLAALSTPALAALATGTSGAVPSMQPAPTTASSRRKEHLHVFRCPANGRPSGRLRGGLFPVAAGLHVLLATHWWLSCTAGPCRGGLIVMIKPVAAARRVASARRALARPRSHASALGQLAAAAVLDARWCSSAHVVHTANAGHAVPHDSGQCVSIVLLCGGEPRSFADGGGRHTSAKGARAPEGQQCGAGVIVSAGAVPTLDRGTMTPPQSFSPGRGQDIDPHRRPIKDRDPDDNDRVEHHQCDLGHGDCTRTNGPRTLSSSPSSPQPPHDVDRRRDVPFRVVRRPTGGGG